MFRLKTFLCYYSLEGGAKFLGWFNFVYHILMLVGIAAQQVAPEGEMDQYKLNIGYAIIIFIYSLISVYCARQLINGVKEVCYNKNQGKINLK